MIADTISTLVIPSRLPRISLRFLWILGFAFLGSLLTFYIFQINEVTKAGFSIFNHERQIAEFSQESQSLTSNYSRINSLATLEETILSSLNYEKVGKVHYLRVPGSTVVTK